jgi:hypothetical protein
MHKAKEVMSGLAKTWMSFNVNISVYIIITD